MASGFGGWKNKIQSTIHTNTRMNALLNDQFNLLSLGKKKNLNRLKEALQETHQGSESVEPDEVKPKGDPKVNVEEIYRILQSTIEEQLKTDKFFQTYNAQISSKFCQILSREIRGRIKMLRHDRFRIVCIVAIIEKLQQFIDYKMGFNVDPKCDNYSTFTYEGATCYIVATVFMVYKD
ncbi:tctex1 domain-containing protein 1-like isoform X2 [Bradysia coprophila]|uniref:tctex1 domain-containing protein 1-like n=1 Tax=Bradysia coprophila TaxID=38358 RepID=UPI00187DD9C1|nr:tctex1 domain-containing protein 1-like [Bradysia coprophila]XP_037048983.1 tctex1 domain-containing protein 1-like isoform X2 [Bradysia coprophila]